MTATNLVRKNSLILIALVAFASCAKIKINTPSTRYVSPEAQGKLFNGSFRLEQQMGTEGTLDFSGNRLDNPMEYRNNVTGIGFNIDIGLLEKLDLMIKSYDDAPGLTVLKYQFLGDHKKTAKAGNKSLAASIGYGQATINQKEADTSIFNDSNDNIEAEMVQSLLEASVIYGYRPHDDTLLYASIQASKHDINIELEDIDTPAINGKKFTLNTWAYGISAGATRYFRTSYITIEASAQKTDWTHNDPMTYGFLTMALGYNWD